MPWPKTGAINYNGQLVLPGKSRLIKELIV